MLVLIILGIAGVIIAAFVVWACVEFVLINRSIRKDERTYMARKHEILDEISVHLYKLKQYATGNTDNGSTRDAEIRLLQSLRDYITRHF